MNFRVRVGLSIGEVARPRWNVEKGRYHVGSAVYSTKIKRKRKEGWGRGLKWPRNDGKQHNNKKIHAGATEGLWGKRFDRGGARGERNRIEFGAIEFVGR